MHLERRAYAKVNLALAVARPPGPGMLHPIASWMHAVDLFDTVTLKWLGEHHPAQFEVVWAGDAPRPSPIDWPAEKDLAIRALRLVEHALGRTLPVTMRVEKRIPVGGGLGGGSSDAAAVLVGIRDLLTLPLSDAQLAAMSAKLGSDVAYFIGGQTAPGPAVVSGFGDRVERVVNRLAGRSIVLVFPSFGCATGPVYKAFDSLPAPHGFREREVRELAGGADGALFNDLLGAAEMVQPALRPLRQRLEKAAGLLVHMSGSGSTLFVLPEGDEAGQTAVKMAAKMAAETTDISVFVTRLL